MVFIISSGKNRITNLVGSALVRLDEYGKGMQRGQDYNKEFIMLNTVSIKLDNTLISFLDKYSQELKVSKSWIIRQALQNYFSPGFSQNSNFVL